MSSNVDSVITRLPRKRRERVEARAAELIAEEMTLRDVREALALTQERMAELLGIGQDSVSRLERRSDLLLSTLGSYVKAMGGRMQLIAEFPDRPPVRLRGLSGLEESKPLLKKTMKKHRRQVAGSHDARRESEQHLGDKD